MAQNLNSFPVVQAYAQAFGKHYDANRLQFKPHRKNKILVGAWVLIDGDKGETPMSWEDMKEATAAFNA